MARIENIFKKFFIFTQILIFAWLSISCEEDLSQHEQILFQRRLKKLTMVYRIKLGYLWIDRNGILWIKEILRNSVDHSITEELSERVSQLSGSRRLPMLFDLRRERTFPLKMKNYFFKDKNFNQSIEAIAVLMRSKMDAFFCNSFDLSGINPIRPARCFSDESRAYFWLLQFRTSKNFSNDRIHVH